MAVLAPAVDEVVAFVDLGEHRGDVFGVVLEVAVDRDDDVARGMFDAGAHRGGLAVVAAELDDAEARLGLHELGELLARAVG